MLPKVTNDSPNRCQAVTPHGQCINARAEGSLYCLGHGGNKMAGMIEKANINMYQVSKWQERIKRLSDSEVKSLNQEIGILRMSLESLLNRCQDENDLILHQASIAALVLSIEKVVSSCHKMEVRLGEYVNKKNLFSFATEVIHLISEYVPSEQLEVIAKRLAESIEERKEP